MYLQTVYDSRASDGTLDSVTVVDNSTVFSDNTIAHGNISIQ